MCSLDKALVPPERDFEMILKKEALEPECLVQILTFSIAQVKSLSVSSADNWR